MEGPEGGVVVFGGAFHAGSGVEALGVADVVVEVLGVGDGAAGDDVPGATGFLAAFTHAGVAAEAVLAGDGVALLDEGVVGVGADGEDGGVDLLLGLEVDADDAPGDLGFVGVGEDLEGGFEAGVGDEVGAHVEAVEDGPLGGGFAVEAHDEDGVVGAEVGGRVVGGVGVDAEGRDHVGAAGCAEECGEFLERDAGDADGAVEVGVVGDGVGLLGELGEVGEGDEAGFAAGNACEVAAEFEVGGAGAGAVEWDAGGGR